MSAEPVNKDQGAKNEPQLSPAQLQIALERLRSQQNLLGGALAGLAGSLVGAGVWAGVTIATGYQIGWMAIGVGFLVGFAVRAVGKGVDKIFGVAGATLALLGCALGNLLAVCEIVAEQESLGFMEVVSRLDLTTIESLMEATFSPMDLLFYAIAVYEGYKLSFRQVSQQELSSLAQGHQSMTPG